MGFLDIGILGVLKGIHMYVFEDRIF
jgi:hypothetical protein